MSMEALTAGRAPTLRDIARIAGVSVPTVSKVLNGRGDVSAETRERVQEATARVGYRRMPSAAVDALIAEQLVDLVLPAVGDSWASALSAVSSASPRRILSIWSSSWSAQANRRAGHGWSGSSTIDRVAH